jgi:two-component system chemotaxis sensor kinase CheA
MDDLVSDFVCEAAETLGGLQAGLSRLAVDRNDPSAAVEMLRRLHALKGLCGFIGFCRAEALAHAGESLLSALAVSPVSHDALTTLSQTLERLAALLAAAATRRAEPEGEDADLIGTLEDIAAGLRNAPPGAQPAIAEASIGPSARGGQVMPPNAERRTRAPWAGLDTLAGALGDRLGKRIELMVGGDDLRIAPAAAAPLRTALIALVRNACDHGVESPAERRAAAKPSLSLLRLSVHRSATGAVIELADDGRGVDPEFVREQCIASGRLEPHAAAALGADEVQNLIFSPGVTTAASVNSISGRGMGLELVRSELAAIGGAVTLASTPGRGARFVLTLPGSALATPAARSRVAA